VATQQIPGLVRNVGDGRAAELATYIVEKDQPLFDLAQEGNDD
jgi:hypothetical protein